MRLAEHSQRPAPKEGIITQIDLRHPEERVSLKRLVLGLQTCTWITERWEDTAENPLAFYVLHSHGALHPGWLMQMQGRWPFIRYVDLDRLGSMEYGAPIEAPAGGGANRKYQKELLKLQHERLEYNAQFDFLATKLPSLAQGLGLEYYMRFEVASRCLCKSDEHTDLFTIMRSGLFNYGFFQLTRDPPHLSVGFNEFAKRYVGERRMNLKGRMAEQLRKEEGTAGALSVYNSFEVVRVPYFLQPEVAEFTRALSRSKGIYEHSWSAAIARYYQVALFSNMTDVLCLSSQYIFYKHGEYSNEHSCRTLIDLKFKVPSGNRHGKFV